MERGGGVAVMARYQIELYDPFGVRLNVLDAIQSLEYARTVNSIGALTLTLPAKAYDYANFKIDGRIGVYRAVGGGPLALEMETAWLIVRRNKLLSASGERLVKLTAVDGVDLLRRRIVAYAAGAAYAEKSDYADDMMKEIVSQNLGSGATDTTRSIATYLTIQADLSLGASLRKGFAWRNVLTVFQELAQASDTAGTYLAFDVVCTDPTATQAFEFRTYANWRGVDHRWPNGSNPVILSPENGTLANVDLGELFDEEINAAYAGGQGEGAARVTASSLDATRIGLSPLRRSEGFADARQTAVTATVTDEADSLVREGMPRRVFTGKIVPTQGVQYGLDWRWGDYVTAQFENLSYDCRIDTVHVQVDASGNETVDAYLRSET